MRRTGLKLVAVGCALALSGCLTYREYDCRVRPRPEAKAWEVTTTWYDLQSDEDTAEKQREDFDELIQAWRGDGYLMDGVHDGGYVKDRRLRIEGNVLVGSLTRLVDRESRLESFEFGSGDTVRWKDPSAHLVSSNGACDSDSTRVFWAAGSRELKLRARNREFKPRSDFVKRFKAWSRDR